MRSDVPKLLAFAASMALVACAGSPDVPSSIQAKELHFTEMDDNMDQRLVPREIETHLLLYRDFARFDSDDNGAITRNEFNDYLEAIEDSYAQDGY